MSVLDGPERSSQSGAMRRWKWCAPISLFACIPGCKDPDGGEPTDTSADTTATTTATTTAATTAAVPTTSATSSTTGGGGTTDATETTNTSLPGPLCGNGVVEEGEPCDDGNADGDDGCDVGCLPTGVALWTVTSEPDSAISGVAFDAAGNVFLAGYRDQEQDSFYDDALIRKLAPDGAELLAFTYNGDAMYDDYANAIAVDPDGSIYVAGAEGLPGYLSRAFVRKYDPAGQELWAYVQAASDPVDGTISTHDLIAADGTIAAVLVEEFINKDSELHVVVLDSAGQKLWSDATPDVLYAFSVAFSPPGDFVVAGGQRGDDSSDFDVLAIKYGLGGQELWRRQYLDQPGENGQARGVAVSATGDIILTGEQYSERRGNDIWLARLDPGGGVVWSDTYQREPGSGFDSGSAVVWRGDDFYVGGYVFIEGEYDNRWVGRFTGDGAPIWTSTRDLGTHNSGVFDIAANDAMVVAVGYEDLDVNVGTQWIRAYQP